MGRTGERRPLRYRGMRGRPFKRGSLLIAIVSSAIALYLDAGIPLVALRAQRHFSAAAWIGIGCIAIAATWTAVRSWRKVAANRRDPN
jgi:hypothetical protein